MITPSSLICPIGVFDSGTGGRYTLQQIKKELPDYDYLFFGDNAHLPYGDKTPEEIKHYAFEGIQRLFDHGCQIVIVACNTAAAYAIRDRQTQHPVQKALSVTIPGIESVVEQHLKAPLFLSTSATEQSGILEDLLGKKEFTGSITIKACSGFADDIEQNEYHPHLTNDQKDTIIRNYVGETHEYDSIILACTHYGIRYDRFVALYPDYSIIDPSQACAIKLRHYLDHHPEIHNKLSQQSSVSSYRTGEQIIL